MKKILTILIVLSLAGTANAQATVPTGGTGTTTLPARQVLYGSTTQRISSSLNFLFNEVGNLLTVTNASTTNLSATAFCLTGDSCRTTWPSGSGGGGTGFWTRLNNSGIYPATSTDQVLIGNTSTSSLSKLEVVGGATIDTSTTTNATTTSFFATTASTTNLFVGGSASIGTTSQNASLNITRSDGNNLIRLGRTGSSILDLRIVGGYPHFVSSNGGALVLTDAFSDGATKSGRLFFGAYNASTEDPNCGLFSSATQDGTALIVGGGTGLCNAPTTVLFYTGAGTTTTTGTIAGGINSIQQWGLGTISPSSRLHVVASATTTAPATIIASSTGQYHLVVGSNGYLGVGTTTNNIPSLLSVYDRDDGSTLQDRFFFDTTTGTNRTFIIGRNAVSNDLNIDSLVTSTGGPSNLSMMLSGGNLGIGTSSAQYKLTVGGPVGARNFISTSTSIYNEFPLASTTRLIISELGTPAGTFLAVSPTGQVIATTTPSGTGSSFAYPFPSNATTTEIAFNGGLTFSNATGTNATTTNFAAVSASTTNLWASRINVATTSNLSVDQFVSEGNVDTYGLTLSNSVGTNGNNWRLGATGSGWSAGNNKFVIVPPSTTLSSGALFTLDGSTLNVGIGTTSPYARLSVVGQTVSEYFTATSTTATSTLPKLLSTNATTTTLSAGYALFGDAYPLSTDSTVKAEVWGDSNGATQFVIGNRNAGTSAYNCLAQNNDKLTSAVTDYYAQCLNSGSYNDATFGTAMAKPSQMSFENTMGEMSYFMSSTTIASSSQAFNWYTYGRNLSHLKLTLSAQGNLGIGTSTPNAKLSVDTSSTTSAMPAFLVGSSTKTDFLINGVTGHVSIGTTTNTRARLSISNPGLSLPTVVIDGGNAGLDLIRMFRSPNNGGTGQGMNLRVSGNNPYFCFNTGMSETTSGTTRNCSMYSSSQDIFVISTTTSAGVLTGQEPFVIRNTNGYVGLAGTTTPWGSVSINPAFQTAGTPSFVVGSSTKTDFIVTQGGRVGVGTSSPSGAFSSQGTVFMNGLTTSTAGNAVCQLTGGQIVNAGGTTCTTSSGRFKSNIENIDVGLAELLKLTPRSYTRNTPTPSQPTGEEIGLIAEEVEKVEPRLVEYEADGVTPRGVNYQQSTALIIKAIQELDEKVEGGVKTAKESATDNWQWIVIGLLALGMGYQQYQIKKLKK